MCTLETDEKLDLKNEDLNFEIFKSNKKVLANNVLSVGKDEILEFKFFDLSLKIDFKEDIKEVVRNSAENQKIYYSFPMPGEMGERGFTKEFPLGEVNGKKISYYMVWKYSVNKDIILLFYSFFQEI